MSSVLSLVGKWNKTYIFKQDTLEYLVEFPTLSFFLLQAIVTIDMLLLQNSRNVIKTLKYQFRTTDWVYEWLI